MSETHRAFVAFRDGSVLTFGVNAGGDIEARLKAEGATERAWKAGRCPPWPSAACIVIAQHGRHVHIRRDGFMLARERPSPMVPVLRRVTSN